jgi:hypothetical protein
MVTHSAYRGTDFRTLIQAIVLRRTGEQGQGEGSANRTPIGQRALYPGDVLSALQSLAKLKDSVAPWHVLPGWEENLIDLNSDQPSPRARIDQAITLGRRNEVTLWRIRRSLRLNNESKAGRTQREILESNPLDTRVARGQRRQGVVASGYKQKWPP